MIAEARDAFAGTAMVNWVLMERIWLSLCVCVCCVGSIKNIRLGAYTHSLNNPAEGSVTKQPCVWMQNFIHSVYSLALIQSAIC